MTSMEIVLWIALLVVCWAASIGVNAAYRNGVTDGYGFSRERWNPGYRRAGEYLKQYMAHRWPELRCTDLSESDSSKGKPLR